MPRRSHRLDAPRVRKYRFPARTAAAGTKRSTALVIAESERFLNSRPGTHEALLAQSAYLRSLI